MVLEGLEGSIPDLLFLFFYLGKLHEEVVFEEGDSGV